MVVLAGRGVDAAEPVVITTAAPIEKLDAGEQPVGVTMATVGASYSLVHPQGDSVVLKDGTGALYLIAIRATNYTPPPAPTTAVSATIPGPSSATSTTSPPPAPATPTVTSTTHAPGEGGGLSKDDEDKMKALNDAFGIPLLADGSFWQDDVAAVARRIGWPQESQTATQESYRRYAIGAPVQILGAGAYSLALYGKNGKPTYLSLVFANAGDFAEARTLGSFPTDAGAVDKVTSDLADAVKQDAATITATLTALLGDPVTTSYGNSSSDRDEVHRWDWKDVAILLNAHEGEFASLKIVPADVADNHGTVEVTDRDEMRDLLAQRVVKRDNGDVVVSEVPMVDQGPKGYCVPATWERYLRYMDVPADLYVLAIMGQTRLGGGTSTDAMQAGVDAYVSAYHRRIETYDAPLDVSHVARYIDQGLPLMWTCWVTKPVEIQTNEETVKRRKVTDWPSMRTACARATRPRATSPRRMRRTTTATCG
jgi:hypothetical protein